LGLVDYSKAYAVQKECVQEVIDGREPALILCEHPLVITLGRLAKAEHIFLSKGELAQKGIKLLSIDRGGDVTLHAPGQLVIYPILNLTIVGKDLRWYLNRLEQVAIDLLESFGIVASRISGQTGVWIEGKKVASVGVGVKKWISFHGLAVNINTNTELFSLIKPCGLDVTMTSIAEVKGKPINMQMVKERVPGCFDKVFS